jgi:hypothetical protein
MNGSPSPSTSPDNVIFFFIDGLGAGSRDPAVNPVAKHHGRYFRLYQDSHGVTALPGEGVAILLDATLGVPGIPQSATGQTALLTGINAAKVRGRHLFGFPDRKLRELLMRESIIRKLRKKGKNAAFVNAFRPLFFKVETDKILSFLSATTISNLAGNAPFLSLDDLKAERAVYQDITNRSLQEKGFDVPLFSPRKAGGILARISGGLDFTLYEYFQTDRAGHSQNMSRAVTIVEMLEQFMHALLESVDHSRTTVIVTSDHGNIEDLGIRTHTHNRVPLMVWGKNARAVIETSRSIVDVPRRILTILDSKSE